MRRGRETTLRVFLGDLSSAASAGSRELLRRGGQGQHHALSEHRRLQCICISSTFVRFLRPSSLHVRSRTISKVGTPEILTW
jgi:hypothetical protein